MRCTEVLIDNLTNNFSKITQTVPSGLTLYMQASQSRVIGEPAIVREGDDGATANYITSVIEIILPIFIDY